MRSCKLILKDEVNCKFQGLDADTRRKCSVALKFFNPGARYAYAYKMGRWDGKIAFFNAVNGETSINLLDRVLPIIEEAKYEIELEDNRKPVEFDFEPITADILHEDGIVWPEGHRLEGELVTLEEHQVRAANALLENPHSVVEAATGFGKTLLCAVLAKRVVDRGRMLLVVPGIDLVTQTAGVLNQMGIETGMFYGGEKDLTKQVTICTWQSMHAFYKKPRGMDQLTEEEIYEILGGVKTLIVDECFAGSTMIETPNGEVAIADLEIGDEVWTRNESTNKNEIKPIVKIHKNIPSNEKMFHLEMDDGTVVEVTGNHKFMTTRGWIRVDELLFEDEIVCFQ